jgi:outer membrane receptor protein involved in Fe transport
MTLEQIPADAIESVEIITNPSAKFDASGGTAGILNIVLKKNRKVGYNGSLRTNIDSRGRIGLGGDINVRQNKINVFLNANYNQRRSKSTGTTERTTKGFFPDYYQFQEDNSVFDGNFKFIRTGIDYFITNRTTLSGSVNIANGKFESYNRNLYRTDFDVTPDSSTLTQRTSDATREFKNFGASLNFKHNFPKAGREWTADVNYRGRSGPSDNLLTNTLYNPDFITINEQLLQRQIGDGQSKSIIIQSDFVNPLSENSKMELGVRAAFNNNKNNNAYYDLDPATRNIILPATSVQDYESNDRVLAAYATFSNRIGNFGYQLGLRTESSNYQGEMKLTSEKFNIDYAISLFPSVFLSQKLKNDQELQLNYSRRINRPNFWQLTPVIDSSDALNPSVGNPGLKPEFTNSLEMSYQKIFKNKDNFLASVYYKNTNDLITNFQETWIDPVSGKRQFLSTYINANSSFVTGLELTMRNNIAKWWELTTNFNLFTSKIKVDHPEFAQQDPFASWFGKINNSFKVTKKLTFQLSGSYQSRTVLPPGGGGGGRGGGGGGMFGQSSSAQGYIKPVYFVDAAVRYTFLKENRGTLSLNMNDVLRTRVSDIHTESPTQIYDAFRRRDPQILRLTFSWRFGKFDTSLFKRKTNKPSDDGNDGGMNMGL